MTKSVQKRIALVAVTALALVGIAGCASPAGTTAGATNDAAKKLFSGSGTVGHYKSAKEIANAYDTGKLCGDKDIRLGLPGYDDSGYQRIIAAEVKKELAAHCPKVSVVQTNANADAAKMTSDMNSLVAQGVNAILTHAVFGESELPSFRKALGAGVPVVAYIGDSKGTVGTDLTQSVTMDFKTAGEQWAGFLDRSIGKGTVAFGGGGPQSPITMKYFEAFKTALQKYPNLKLVNQVPFQTNYVEADHRTAVAALLAQYGRVDAIVTDSGNTSSPTFDAYAAAGFKPPAIATVAGDNNMACKWKAAGSQTPLYSTDGNTVEVLPAVRFALAAINHIEDPEPNIIAPIPAMDTTDPQLAPRCEPNAPLTANWSSSLSDEEMISITK